MNSKSLFASIATALVLLPAAAQAAMNAPLEFPAEPASNTVNFPVAAASEGCTDPAYPTPSLRQSQEGSVKVRFLVDGQGQVKDADVARSSGHRALDTAAVEAVRKCSFKPQSQQANAAGTWQEVKYVWSVR